MSKKTRFWTPQECIEYAEKKSKEVPESMRLEVYWGTIKAMILSPPIKWGKDDL